MKVWNAKINLNEINLWVRYVIRLIVNCTCFLICASADHTKIPVTSLACKTAFLYAFFLTYSYISAE